MKSSMKFRHYIWLLNLLVNKERISLEEINRKWIVTDMSDGVELSRFAFSRYRKDIQDMFDIDIACDRRTNKYYIENPQVLRDDSVQQWMLSAISVGNLVSESQSLQDRILLENIPYGGKMISLIIEAMKRHRLISFQYKKYSDSESKERLITPCCIKLFRQRWYVIDYNTQTSSVLYKPFAFDRISNLQITDKPFELPADFNAGDIFRNSFGIFVGDAEKPQPIVIRAFGDQRKYIRDLPLHHSQEVLAEGDDYTDYRYFILPSFDFKAELLSKGNRIEVISPQSLREEIKESHLQAARLYEK